MRSRTISLPILAAIGGTRGMLGAGLGLLAAGKLSDSRRRTVGRSLLAVGLLSTIPLLLHVFRGRDAEPSSAEPREPRSGGAVDAPGKHHRQPPPSVHGSKHFDQPIAKSRVPDYQHRRV